MFSPGVEGLGRAFVNYFPALVLENPVLAFAHMTVEVVTDVILFEGDDGQLLFAVRITEHADVGQLDIDLGLAGLNATLVS